ncbi:MAG TPA: multifunctional CCA tRNA nucleotidyl transferase/2'3'-cyclic phosphodiesterase/2'nucleotidase/phosphatase [Burkholderiales bacterium]
MKVYTVGGAVRDELLGRPVRERDYVVVGATPEEMVAKGFKPVGKDFPVFLHPKTHEEYALARTERKSGRGYKGFTVYASPEVTLEEDLRRRDLTINAMAKAEDGTLVDPFGGRKDLSAKTLRHVSEAFAENPMRILRVARFAARFGFAVHETTMALMQRMVEAGETDYLVPERVWQEFAKGLAEPHAEKMFEVLEASGLLRRNLPEIGRYPRRFAGSLAARYALLAWPLDEAQVESLSNRLRAPNEVRELALAAARCRKRLHAKDAEGLLELFKAADAFRRPQRFAELLDAAQAADAGIDRPRIERALEAAGAIDAASIARSAQGPEIARRIDDARLQAIRSLG